MSTVRVGTKDIGGITYELRASEHGTWYIAEEGEEGEIIASGETLDSAVAKVRTAVARTKVTVEVPFISRGGQHGVAYSIHAKQRDPMVRWADGVKEAFHSYGGVFPPDTPEEIIDRYCALIKQRDAASKEITSIDRTHYMDLNKAVREAIEAKAAALTEKEEVTA